MKRFLVIFVTILMCIGFTSCSRDRSGGNDSNQTTAPTKTPVEAATETLSPTKEPTEDKITVFFERVKEAGLDVGDEVEKVPEIIGAEKGTAYYVNGQVVEVYEYNPSALTVEGKVFYDSAKNNGIIEIIEGFASNVIFHNDLVLFYEEHQDSEKLIEIFNGL